MSAPDLAEPWRSLFARHHQGLKTLPDPDLALIVSLAADGLFFLEILGLAAFPEAVRARLIARLHALADQTAGADA